MLKRWGVGVKNDRCGRPQIQKNNTYIHTFYMAHFPRLKFY